MKKQFLLVLLITLGVKSYSQERLSLVDGEIHQADKIITINEFKVLLEERGMLTYQNTVRLNKSERYSVKADNQSKKLSAGLIGCLTWLPTAHWLENEDGVFYWSEGQITYGLISMITAPLGSILLLDGLIPYDQMSLNIQKDIIDEYNLSLTENN